MKKLLIFAVLAVAVVTIGLLWPNSEADALGCVKCFPGGIVGPTWGFGSTCAAATNDAINQAYALIPYSCDVCQTTPIGVLPCDDTCSNPTTCYDPYGEWRVDMKLRFRCSENLCIP